MHVTSRLCCTALCIPAVMLASSAQAQQRPVPAAFAPITNAVAAELSGERALGTVAYVEQFFRLPGNRGFDASIDTVARLLERAGFVNESRASASQRFTYRIESRPMRNLAWTPESASVTLEGRSAPLLRFETNRNMVAINSNATPPSGVTAPVVAVGGGTEADFDRVNVRGAIVFSNVAGSAVFNRAMTRGAIGVLAAQRLPPYNKPAQNVNAIGFSSVPRDTVNNGWMIYLSPAARDSVAAALTASAGKPLQVHVHIAARFERRPERTLVAEIRGATLPDERFVYSAHVQEPGANDNASGVGLLAEMARVASKLVESGRARPARTITFLWGDEIRATARYLNEDSTRRKLVRWGMSLDMVGENTALTGGTFLIEKMPDPSAVWVRGEDQHSEWGGRPIAESAVRPHWFNDYVRQRCLDRAATTSWVVKSNPFEGGSDHTPFLDAGIPALLLWHFTDQFYHTDRDRIDMVSSATLENVGNCALVSGLLLAEVTPSVARGVLNELAAVAERTLEYQAKLSRDTLSRGGSVETERNILTAWRDYYLGATERVGEIATTGAAAVADAQSKIRGAAAAVIDRLR